MNPSDIPPVSKRFTVFGDQSPRTRFLLEVIFVYAVLSVTWIHFSDRALEYMFGTTAFSALSEIKGTLYVLISSVVLFLAMQAVPPESKEDLRDGNLVLGLRHMGHRIAEALIIAVVTCALQWLVWAQLAPYAWVLFYPAVCLAAWRGGLAGGMTATLVTAAAVWYLFMPPHFSFDLHAPAALWSLIIAVGMGIAISMSLARIRRLAHIAGEARFRGLVEQTVVGMYIMQDDRFIYVNPGMAHIFGYAKPRELLELQDMLAMVSPGDRDRVRAQVYARESGRVDASNYRFTGLRRDGSEVRVEVYGRAFENHGRPAVIGVLLDVTASEAAAAQTELAAQVFSQNSEGITVTDSRGKIVMVNAAFSRITGYSEEEVVGKSPGILSSGLHDAAFYRTMWHSIESNGGWSGEIWNRRKDGSIYPERLSINCVRDGNGQPHHYIGIFSDITRHKEDEQRIQRLANFDALTSLPNRALLGDLGRHDVSLAQRSGTPLAVIYLDLDQFKFINDTLGHMHGDELLTEVAHRLSALAREQDTVARLGGDEFVLVLPGADADGAAHVARRLLDSVVQPYQLGEQELVVTASAGIALFPIDGRDFDGLLKSAEIAMYRAKADGRNCWREFSADMHDGSARTLMLENSLRRALEREQLELYFQPQYALADTRIVGAEVLLRWRHPELGFISPAEFIPIAESSGQILAIGDWVLRGAARQVRDWTSQGLPPLTFAVNLSALQFRQPGLPDMVMEVLRETGVPPHLMELELTESVAMDHAEDAIAMMDKLHALGLRMSVDDFGTGYSSLSYLKRFKVYKLKIDQSFVRDIAEDADDRAIVAAIINLARGLGLHTIAEGVETQEQLEFLRDNGCDEVQGFLLGKPMPAEQFEKLLRDQLARTPLRAAVQASA